MAVSRRGLVGAAAGGLGAALAAGVGAASPGEGVEPRESGTRAGSRIAGAGAAVGEDEAPRPAGTGVAGAGQSSSRSETLQGYDWEVVTEGFNDAAVQAAMERVLAAQEGGAARLRLVLPPGEYHLSRPLLARIADYPVDRLDGLWIEGAGKRTTRIVWQNDGSDPFLTADRPRLRFLTVKGFTIASSDSGNEFAYCYSDTQNGYNQGWYLGDLEFQGSWNRVIGLDGPETANLNSEFTLERVYTATDSEFGDAFLRSGGITGSYDQQVQFLNYWIRDCCLTLRRGTVFRFDRGGGIHVQNGSWSAADSSSGPITWFHLPRGNSNTYAAQQLSVRSVRFEPKAANHRIIDCSWAGGTVLFDSCTDEGSIQNTAGIGYNLHRYTGNALWNQGTMPSVRYVNCVLAGYHQYDGPTVTRGGFTYEGSFFFRGTSGNTANAVSGSDPVLRWSDGAPRYRFVDCWNIENTGSA